MPISINIPGGGGGGASGAMTLIASSTLAANAGSVDFQNIPGTYSSLVLMWTARTTTVGSSLDGMNIRFNADSGNNYDYQTMVASASAMTVAEILTTSSAQIGTLPQNSVTTGIASVGQAVIPAYAGTVFHKSVVASNTCKIGTASGNLRNQHHSGFWRSGSAITRITLIPQQNNFLADSTFYLYGIG